MTVRATGINPEMLRWARERAGYSVEDVAKRRHVAPKKVQEWEDGKSSPTWRQLEDLAHKDYHRATGFFFLDTPPEENTVAAEFRRLPGAMLEGLEPDTRYAIRQARVRQEQLRILLGPQGTGERFLLRDLQGHIHVNAPDELASEVRSRLEIEPEEQKSWPSDDEALKRWREKVEDNGVWVFKRTFRQKDIAGFCLNDPVFPVIYLNNGQAKTRQIFTLFHELAHLLFDFNHLERRDPDHYLPGLNEAEQAIETACNRFAGEFLVPADDFDRVVAAHAPAELTDEYLKSLADRYKVSREVILRKFHDRGRVDGTQYAGKVREWASSYEPGSGAGGNYYATQAAYLGQKYLRTAFQAFDDGRIDELELAGCLGVKGANIDGLEKYAWR